MQEKLPSDLVSEFLTEGNRYLREGDLAAVQREVLAKAQGDHGLAASLSQRISEHEERCRDSRQAILEMGEHVVAAMERYDVDTAPLLGFLQAIVGGGEIEVAAALWPDLQTELRRSDL